MRLASLDEEPPEGSNSWVVAPAKSATGPRHHGERPPPRLFRAEPSLPGPSLGAGPGRDRRGRAGAPGISLGHNGSIAFGLTIFNIDQEDLYVYELNPADASQYRYEGRLGAIQDRVANRSP